MNKIFRLLTLFTLLSFLSCNKSDDDSSNGEGNNPPKLSKIISTSSSSVFTLEFNYAKDKLSEVKIPSQGKTSKIVYENNKAKEIQIYIDGKLEATTTLIYENDKLIKTDNGVNSNFFIQFSYNGDQLSKAEQFTILENGELRSDFTMEYSYDLSNNVTKRTLSNATSVSEYFYTYDNKKHHYSDFSDPVRIYFFWPEGLSANNALTSAFYINQMVNSEYSYELTYNELNFPLTSKVKNKDGETTTSIEYVYK
jgi:archaellum component FlaF (FlaF/FlaG flagellin family)